MVTTILGLDPGSSSSPTAISVFKDGILTDTISIQAKDTWPPRERVYYITNCIKAALGLFMPDFVGIETGHYQGIANERLLRLLGALENEIPLNVPIIRVNPKTLKKFFGSGNLEKNEMADIMLEKWLATVKEKNILKEIIKNERWDESDAIAVGIYVIENCKKS